jgi:hypothetical protein
MWGWSRGTLPPRPYTIMNTTLAKKWEELGAVFPKAKNGRPRKTLPQNTTKLAEEFGVSKACELLGIARTTYYRHIEWSRNKQ